MKINEILKGDLLKNVIYHIKNELINVIFKVRTFIIDKKENVSMLYSRKNILLSILIVLLIVCVTGCKSDKYNTEYIKLSDKYSTEYIKLSDEFDVFAPVAPFEDGLIPVRKSGKYGYINKEGNEVISCVYDYAGSFSEDLAVIKKNNKYGVIDKEGNEVIPCAYDTLSNFSEGFAQFTALDRADNWMGYVGRNGNEIIVISDFLFSRNFSEGLALVCKDGKYGYIDKNGTEVIPLIYDGAYDFSEGLALVCKDGKYGYIDKNGTEVIPLIYDGAKDFVEGLALVCKDGKYVYIDKNGTEVIPFIYDSGYDFVDGRGTVKKDGKWGYLDKNGDVQYTLGTYQLVMPLSNGLFLVGNGYDPKTFTMYKYGYIDENGSEVIPCEYDYISDFSDGIAFASKGKQMYIVKINKVD